MIRPVIILGAIPRIAVPIARSLADLNVRVTVASFDDAHVGLGSRVLWKHVRLPHPSGDDEGFKEELLRLIDADGYDMLIPLGDSSLTAVVKNYGWLTEKLHVACPEPAVLQRVLDKDLTLLIAAKNGVPVPKTRIAETGAELRTAVSELGYPVIIKPCSKLSGSSCTFKYALIATSTELVSFFPHEDRLEGKFLVQQYAPGYGVGIELLMHLNMPVASFQHRRLREFPYDGGVSAVAVSEPVNANLLHLAVTLLRALEWEGVAMVEFRYDPTTGQAALMEVNGRYWGSLSLSIQSGINFPICEWNVVHGRHVTGADSYRAGVRSRWFLGDLLRLNEVVTGTSHSIPHKLRETGAFLSDFYHGTRDMLWSWKDPGPWVEEFVGGVKDLAKNNSRLILKALIPEAFRRYRAESRYLEGTAQSLYLWRQLRRHFALLRERKSFPPGIRTILFVCHGNIIRSPLAEVLLRNHLHIAGIEGYTVHSAGLNATTGSEADPRAVEVGNGYGISLADHRARLLTAELITQSDAVFVMDFFNEARILQRFPLVAPKLYFLGAFSEGREDSPLAIADPYEGRAEDIASCFLRIRKCTDAVSRLLARAARPVTGIRSP